MALTGVSEITNDYLKLSPKQQEDMIEYWVTTLRTTQDPDLKVFKSRLLRHTSEYGIFFHQVATRLRK